MLTMVPITVPQQGLLLLWKNIQFFFFSAYYAETHLESENMD